jgi:hypothetical protein
MSTLPLLGVVATLIFCGVIASSYAQVADHIVINELDTNPQGDDAKGIIEWVEIYNPTGETVNIGGWQVVPTSSPRKAMTIAEGTVIRPGQFLVYSHMPLWLADISEKVQLKDKTGNIIDETPTISDQNNDSTSWQRRYDAYDTNSTNDWIFRAASPGSSNGKLDTGADQSSTLSVSVQSNKNQYVFSETAIISGKVSEQVFQVKPFFSQQQIEIVITGPQQYNKKITLFPDRLLNFKTELKLDRVQGIAGGNYLVSVTYGSAKASTSFAVGQTATETAEGAKPDLSLSVEGDAYIPGQRVAFSASTNKIIQLEGLKVEVYDSNRKQIYSGTLYPNTRGEFSGNLFLTTVNPVFGTYTITAKYGSLQTEATFNVQEDVRDLSQIVISTDKKVYGPGETIVVTGRSNKFVPALNMAVIQAEGDTARTGANVFRLNTLVSMAGDGTFRYDLQVPATQSNLGDFRVTVSREFGSATTTFKIVSDPSQYVETEKRNFVTTDKADYLVGDKITVSGTVIPRPSSTFVPIPVTITIEDSTGKSLSIIAKERNVKTRTGDSVAAYQFTAIPDAVGNYKVEFTADRAVFEPGRYVIKATYDRVVVTTSFTVESSFVRSTDIVAKTDKTVYGLGETVMVEGTLYTGQPTVKIVMLRPDGRTVVDGATIRDFKFSWSWQVPQTERTLADVRDPRGQIPSVFGNYKISIMSPSKTTDLFFKVSANPESDRLNILPLEVRTDKSTYAAGDRLVVTGAALVRDQASSNLGGVPDRVNIQIRNAANKVIFDSTPTFDSAGYFRATYDLPLTVFTDGTYKIVATYQKNRADATFEVRNNLPLGGAGGFAFLLRTDKAEYSSGDTMQITGTSNRINPLTRLNLMILEEKDANIRCDNFQCGLVGSRLDISRSYDNGIYKHAFTIPPNTKPGTYVVRADAEFGSFTTSFKIVERVQAPTPVPVATVSEKFNRLDNSTFDIALVTTTIDGQNVVPTALYGSMITTRGSELDVNLRVVSGDGICVIGQDLGCMVSHSTRGVNVDYVSVMVGGLEYHVEYSGHDKSVEKFSITAPSGSAITDSIWTIDIVKGNQPSKFYYELVYKVQ